MEEPDETMDNSLSARVSRTEHDWSEVDPTTAVVESVASVCGCDPVALEPMTESIDPDALNRFVRSTDAGANVSFRYASHDVTVRSDGDIAVTRAQP